MTTARIDARFAALKAEGRAGFVAYVMAGDPTRDEALQILRGLPAAGADLIELGFPFSDPMAEGPPIQRAALRGLKAGLTLKGTLALAADFRAGDADTPVILMGYLNPIESYGYDAFARDAAASGIDGLIVVDCPPEEAGPLSDLRSYGSEATSAVSAGSGMRSGIWSESNSPVLDLRAVFFLLVLAVPSPGFLPAASTALTHSSTDRRG